MSGVKAISGATGKEFEALEAQAKSLGATTKFTAVEAAEGQKFLAQAGFETNQIIGTLPGTLNLAAAANVGLGKSADIVSNVLKGFGATAESTNKFVDVLTNTFTTSNTDLLQLGSAMRNVAPVAAKLGLSVEETAAALGKMGDAGIQGGAAGTQLKNALLALAAPSAQQAELMKRLGIEVFDASGQFKSLPEVVGEVQKGLSQLSEEEQIAALKTLATKRAIAGFQVLLKEGQGELADYTQEVGVLGNTSKIAETQLDNLEGDVTLLNSAFSAFKITAFERMEPTLREASKALTDFLTLMNEAPTIAKAAVDAGQGGMFEKAFYSEATQGWIDVKEEIELTNSTIEIWKEQNVRAALEAGKSFGPYQRQVEGTIRSVKDLATANQDYIPTVTDIVTRSEAQARAMTAVVSSADATISSLGGMIDLSKDLTDVMTDESQQSVELNRVRNTGLFVIDESTMALNALTREIGLQQEAREAAILAEQREIEMLSALAGTQADFFTSIGSAREDALQSERSFNASITDIRTSAAEAQTSARESSNEKLISLEEQRAAEEHRILTGAHARTTVENDNLLAANNTHFQQLKDAELTALGERQAAVEADFADRESKAQAARAKEVAEQQAHLEELKLNAALATLESVGQLEQFTGGLTVSASEAADLIRAGVIPVTDELGAAVQSTLGGLQEKEAEAAAQAVSNQALLQQAYAGTLVPLQAQAAALGTEIPTAAAAAQQSMG
ncbi:MAG: phage tail tape measure protein, partial [Candidatus Thorarchaeota archaeon]